MNYKTQVLVVGGSIGGTLAALSAAKQNKTVILTEETDWLGGQFTSQGVPPDEHQWIEETGCTDTYRQFREKVRQYYKDHYPLTEEALNDPKLNPGEAWVSRLSHEPKVALKVLEDMLAPYLNSGRITFMKELKPVSCTVENNQVKTADFVSLQSGKEMTIAFEVIVDATECGDILPLAGAAYALGSEGYAQTKEAHASKESNAEDVQAFTYVFGVDYIEDGQFTIKKPKDYDFWKNYIPPFHFHSLLDWRVGHENDQSSIQTFALLPNDEGKPALFTYRRALSTALLEEPVYEGDVSLINWPQNDYFLGSIIDVSEEEKAKHIEQSKQLSLSVLYWLQTKAPRGDGKKGYPELRLRKDLFDTEDGLAKYPYIRESRRIKALYTIVEEDVSIQSRGTEGIKEFEDSVGVGSYHLDLHTTTQSKRSMYIPTYPYEIPLRALIPNKLTNLLAGCKNIGTTHITNGCYRLHPTEWNIGEVAGYLSSYMIDKGMTGQEVAASPKTVQAFQQLIAQQGIQLHWPDHVKEEVLLKD